MQRAAADALTSAALLADPIAVNNVPMRINGTSGKYSVVLKHAQTHA
jgi:hypothetical protein